MNLLRAVLVISAVPALAQTWSSNAGGWNTGYGTVYGSFGTAMATQNIYNSMQLNMQRTMMRQAMINKFGLAAVEKAEREAKSGQPSKAPAGLTVTAPPPAPKNLGVFKPTKSNAVAKQLGDSLGKTPEGGHHARHQRDEGGVRGTTRDEGVAQQRGGRARLLHHRQRHHRHRR